MEDEDNNAQMQVTSILAEFEGAGGTYSSPLPLGGKLQDVFNQVVSNYGSIADIPSTMSGLRNALATYEETTRNSYQLHGRSTDALQRLNQAITNTKSPTAKNGGQQIDAVTYLVGYSPEKLPGAKQLTDSLKNDGNAITLSLSASNFTAETTSLSMENRVSFTVFLGFLSLSVNHTNKFDYSSYMYEDSSMEIDMKYPGVTLIGVAPSALTTDGSTGWYAEDILLEIAEKSGKNATGYQLQGSEFSVDELFGKGKRLSRLRTFVISQYPTVTMTMNKVDVSSVSKHFETDNDISISLFDCITLGEHSSTYKVSSVTSDASSESITVTFAPPAISSDLRLDEQVAYVLGGVASYPGIRG
jgi:hypothetical protein